MAKKKNEELGLRPFDLSMMAIQPDYSEIMKHAFAPQLPPLGEP
jgi:hypothetical protein